MSPSYQWYDETFQEGYIEHKVILNQDKRETQAEDLRGVFTASTGEDMDDQFDRLLREDNVIWATLGDMTVGALAYEWRGQAILVHMLYIRDAYKRMGIGTSLMRKVMRKTDQVFIVSPTEEAKHLYERLGFEPKDPEGWAYGLV